MGYGADEEYERMEDYEPEDEPPRVYNLPRIKHETDLALLVITGKGLFWVPKSIVIERSAEVLIIPAWFEPKFFKDDRGNNEKESTR